MQERIRLPLILALALSPAAGAEEAMDFTEEANRIGYSLGYQLGENFVPRGTEIRAEAIIEGIEDALSGAQTPMPLTEIRSTLIDLKRERVTEKRAERAKELKEKRSASRAFLRENAEKEGVTVLPSGLQYEIITAGEGASPGPRDTVTVHYRGTLADGTEFDSSYERENPATFRLDRVIAGWTEGMQLMKEGGRSRFYIPPELAYGDRGHLAGEALVFEVELLSVGAAAQPQGAQAGEKGTDDGASAGEPAVQEGSTAQK